jgi:hypothetical protein
MAVGWGAAALSDARAGAHEGAEESVAPAPAAADPAERHGDTDHISADQSLELLLVLLVLRLLLLVLHMLLLLLHLLLLRLHLWLLQLHLLPRLLLPLLPLLLQLWLLLAQLPHVPLPRSRRAPLGDVDGAGEVEKQRRRHPRDVRRRLRQPLRPPHRPQHRQDNHRDRRQRQHDRQ